MTSELTKASLRMAITVAMILLFGASSSNASNPPPQPPFNPGPNTLQVLHQLTVSTCYSQCDYYWELNESCATAIDDTLPDPFDPNRPRSPLMPLLSQEEQWQCDAADLYFDHVYLPIQAGLAACYSLCQSIE